MHFSLRLGLTLVCETGGMCSMCQNTFLTRLHLWHTALWSILRCYARKHAQLLVYSVSANGLEHTINGDQYLTFCYHWDMFVLILMRGQNVRLKSLIVNCLLNMNYFILSNWQPHTGASGFDGFVRNTGSTVNIPLAINHFFLPFLQKTNS